ncbi:unnamed protein product [Dracunculus medinensis]|uniref:Uncharacterized protein n=1 Tax=Dracunculus medinensis TaxID=318479 RepID=A0A0N4ULU1_DRAME|nr:unnamed protein product [Dracunculus medinensis]
MVDKGNNGDPRKNYILRIASHLFALNVNENKLQNLNAIQKFCDTNASLLIVEKNETNGSVKLSNELINDNVTISNVFRIIFYKIKSVPLTIENYKKEISLITLQSDSSEEGFLNSIRQLRIAVNWSFSISAGRTCLKSASPDQLRKLDIFSASDMCNENAFIRDF